MDCVKKENNKPKLKSTHEIWCYLRADSVRIKLNCRTTSWCWRISFWEPTPNTYNMLELRVEPKQLRTLSWPLCSLQGPQVLATILRWGLDFHLPTVPTTPHLQTQCTPLWALQLTALMQRIDKTIKNSSLESASKNSEEMPKEWIVIGWGDKTSGRSPVEDELGHSFLSCQSASLFQSVSVQIHHTCKYVWYYPRNHPQAEPQLGTCTPAMCSRPLPRSLASASLWSTVLSSLSSFAQSHVKSYSTSELLRFTHFAQFISRASRKIHPRLNLFSHFSKMPLMPMGEQSQASPFHRLWSRGLALASLSHP